MDGGDGERPVVVYRAHPVGLPVDRRAGVAVGADEFPPVAPGLHEVADPGDSAIAAQLDACLLDAAQLDELGAQRGVDPRGLLVARHQQHRLAPGERVRQPRPGRCPLGLVGRPGTDEAAVALVLAQHVGVAVAKPQRRRPLPGVAEPAHLGQLVADGALGEITQRSTGADRAELTRVADQQQLRPGLRAARLDGGELAAVHHPGLVHDQQVPGGQPPRLVPTVRCSVLNTSAGVRCVICRTRRDGRCPVRVSGARPGRGGRFRSGCLSCDSCRSAPGLAFVGGGEPVLGGEPAGGVGRGDGLVAQYLGGHLGRGEPEHPVPARLPRARDCAGGDGLAGAGRGGEDLQPGAGAADPAHRGGLILTEVDAVGGVARERRVGVLAGDGGGAAGDGGAAQRVHPGDLVERGVARRGGPLIRRGAVVEDVAGRQVARVLVLAKAGHSLDQLSGEPFQQR